MPKQDKNDLKQHKNAKRNHKITRNNEKISIKGTNSKMFNANDGNFGNYKEYTGGGHPFEKGNSTTREADRKNGKYRQEHNDTNQPRTEDGKFTYNSVNGKGLKYPSRGTTVNPLLTGGENGIHYKEYNDKNGFHSKEEARSNTNWKEWAKTHQWWEKGTEIVGFDGKIHLTAESLMDLVREYDPKTKKFKGEDNIAKGEVKKGRHSTEEKNAIQKATSKGMLGRYFVPANPKKPTESGYKEFGNESKTAPTPQPKPTPAPTPSPVQPAPSPNNQSTSRTKYDDSQVSQLGALLGMDLSDFTDNDIDELLGSL